MGSLVGDSVHLFVSLTPAAFVVGLTDENDVGSVRMLVVVTVAGSRWRRWKALISTLILSTTKNVTTYKQNN